MISLNPHSRSHWIDAARGAAILLVVFGHGWRGLYSAGLIGDASLFEAVDRFIYAFHMPLFFFLSGFLLPGARLRSFPSSVLRNVERLIWPLALWNYIFLALVFTAGSGANTPVDASEIFVLPLPPQKHFWFLWALFLIATLVQAIRIWVPEPTRVSWVAFLIGAIGVCLLWDMPDALRPWAQPAVLYLPIYLLGAVMARLDLTWPRSIIYVLGAVAAFIAAGWAAVTLPTTLLSTLTLAAVMSWTFIAVIQRFAGTNAFLVMCGQASMAIFLSHTIFSAFFRIVLLKFDLTNLPLHLILAMIAGVGGPLILRGLARQFGLSRLLGFGT